MEDLTQPAKMTKALWILAVCVAMVPRLAYASGSPRCDRSEDRSGYPSFCDIPYAPKDIRTAAAFKAVVVETRTAGQRTVVDSQTPGFALGEGEAEPFAATGRTEAAPPPPMSAFPQNGAETFASEARSLAAPPVARRK